ncbi:Chromosome-associated kinesin KIF4B [Wickerhamomyces ciferrii]|uniref:Kinesin-like protein n=1 Tax=Wickerhamomyces ciferrii (strain ATCC 14091 / BCRC 22168 / CBS 111 / JCM 3599 / NBRC 0793 / NRRL Y-1031 F-60-10) TaxID=1206466 RepID=K0KGE2_WICCF|nr:Chromosome-associated kinesin KIF4B [Wickerhamomyces ciferrii]CCH40504.1 Chromosome-associated kinesin KIF4B [Wickerhamomyces ciferrii]
MYSRSQTPRRQPHSALPSTPNLRPSSRPSSRANTPSSAFRPPSTISRYERPFSPLRERPSSAMSLGSSRPQTPSFATPQQPYTGTISVAVRAKPSDTFIKDPWFLTNESIEHSEVGEFKFDHVFHPSVSNSEVYDKTVKNLINQLMDGYNATVFAYGMTGSGKTYSMSGTKHEPGVIPLSVSEIFRHIENSDKEIYKHELKVSYLEIYNERIFDLLNINQITNPTLNNSAQSDLKIRDVPGYGVKVLGLIEESVKSEQELLTIIQKGDVNRRTGETDFNSRSSRSHAIVLVRVSTTNTVTGIETMSTLSLCDLAGSEKATAQQERRKEGSFINKSLLALGSVIVKLSSASTSVGHIPYRDSKLTRLLQPALSGDSLVSVLCTIHTSQSALAETVNTVRFAARAKNISLSVRKHEVDGNTEKDRIIEKLRLQVEKQAEEIQSLKENKPVNAVFNSSREGSVTPPSHSQEEMNQLLAENRILIERLENHKRLVDEKNAERIVLKNDILNDIFTRLSEQDMGVDGEQLILKVEELFKKTYAEIEEYKSYINHLETQLKLELQKRDNGNNELNVIKRGDGAYSPSKHASENEVDIIMKEQEDEIFELKEELKNKEKVIRALQSAKRVREGLMSTINMNESRRESGRHESLRPLNGDNLSNLPESSKLRPI